MENTELNKRIYHRKFINKEGKYFGSRISTYLVRKFKKKHIKSPILDAGAGDGALIRTIQANIRNISRENVFGIDLVAFPESNIIEGNIGNMPYQNDFFRTIFCTEVLEHLDDKMLKKTLSEFKRILKKEGVVIATFPFREDLSRNTFVCPHCGKSFHRYGHARTFDSKSKIKKTFSEFGFNVIYLDILPLGAIATLPFLIILKPIINKLNNPPGFRKRAIVIAKKL